MAGETGKETSDHSGESRVTAALAMAPKSEKLVITEALLSEVTGKLVDAGMCPSALIASYHEFCVTEGRRASAQVHYDWATTTLAKLGKNVIPLRP